MIARRGGNVVPKLVRLSIAALAGTLMLSPFLQGQAGLTGFLETFWGDGGFFGGRHTTLLRRCNVSDHNLQNVHLIGRADP